MKLREVHRLSDEQRFCFAADFHPQGEMIVLIDDLCVAEVRDLMQALEPSFDDFRGGDKLARWRWLREFQRIHQC